MRWKAKPQRDPRWYETWHRWFAWRPVRVGEQMVWLEFVERRDSDPYADMFVWEYRLK